MYAHVLPVFLLVLFSVGPLVGGGLSRWDLLGKGTVTIFRGCAVVVVGEVENAPKGFLGREVAAY